MKKIFIILMLISSFYLNAMPSNDNPSNKISIPNNWEEILLQDLQNNPTSINQNSNNLEKITSSLSNIPDKISILADKVNKTFNFVADHIDTLLTKRGAIKTLLILGPLFTLYCHFFSAEPVMELIKKIVSSSSYGASKIASYAAEGFNENQKDINTAISKISDEYGMLEGRQNVMTEIGKLNGLFQSIWDYPFSTMALISSKGINMAATLGVPFASGVLFNKFMKIK
ncbi:hypothetical protein GF322_00420 [Candidatus Dependentiae bacterium]|nr:hypothetical protein [Candidatus Dependentiae bacterium]